MCIDRHQTGFVGKGSDHLQLIKFWPSRAPKEGGLWQGENFWLRLTTANVQCLRLLWALFSLFCCDRQTDNHAKAKHNFFGESNNNIYNICLEQHADTNHSLTFFGLIINFLTLPDLIPISCIFQIFKIFHRSDHNIVHDKFTNETRNMEIQTLLIRERTCSTSTAESKSEKVDGLWWMSLSVDDSATTHPHRQQLTQFIAKHAQVSSPH